MRKFTLMLFVVSGMVLALGCDPSATSSCAGENCEEDEAGVQFTGAYDEEGAPTVGDYFAGVVEEDLEEVKDEELETTPEEEVVEEEIVEEEEIIVEEEIIEDETNLDDLEEEVSLEDLDTDSLAEIDLLRTAIFSGIDVGNDQYLETVSLALSELEITPTYGAVDIDGWEVLDQPVSSCPFVEFYDNGFEPTGYACEYLVDQARSEAYSKLSAKLASQPLPTDVATSELIDEEEARFWIEQGAISGIEEKRVLVQLDIKAKGLCNKTPTPSQSSGEKGLVLGRKLMVSSLNNWLATNGHTADYPVMSNPIEVCNMNATVLNPAEQDALKSITKFMEDEPLCANFEATNSEDDILYGQAQTDYSNALKVGVKDEFALASVKIFKVVPCNVSDPLVLDLDRDGIELLPVHKGVNFDLWSTGNANAVAWTQADDGFLALDRNSNGMIDNGTELFGNINKGHADGFAQLSELDRVEMGGNADGVLNADDAAFSNLLVWQDRNVDGVSEGNELHGLDTFRITALHLKGEVVDMGHAGSPIPAANYVETEDGPMLMGDAFLRTAPYPSLSAYVR